MAANKIFWWDAPKGFKAVKAVGIHCDGCHFIERCNPSPCTRKKRKDQQYVIFIKRENHA